MEGSGTRKGIYIPVRLVSILPEAGPVQPADDTARLRNVPTNEPAKHATEFLRAELVEPRACELDLMIATVTPWSAAHLR